MAGADPPGASTEDLADQESRLTAIINILGHPSLSSLEDFIFLHGAVRLVPLSASQQTNDTQTQGLPPLPSQLAPEQSAQLAKLLERESRRREDFKSVRSELSRAKTQIEFLESEVGKERQLREEVERDWRRVSDDNARLFAERVEGPTGGGDDATALQEEILRLDAELLALQEEIDELHETVQAQVSELERVEQVEEELGRVTAKWEMERERRAEGEKREERERETRAKLEREITKLRLMVEGGSPMSLRQLSASATRRKSPALARQMDNIQNRTCAESPLTTTRRSVEPTASLGSTTSTTSVPPPAARDFAPQPDVDTTPRPPQRTTRATTASTAAGLSQPEPPVASSATRSQGRPLGPRSTAPDLRLQKTQYPAMLAAYTTALVELETWRVWVARKARVQLASNAARLGQLPTPVPPLPTVLSTNDLPTFGKFEEVDKMAEVYPQLEEALGRVRENAREMEAWKAFFYQALGKLRTQDDVGYSSPAGTSGASSDAGGLIRARRKKKSANAFEQRQLFLGPTEGSSCSPAPTPLRRSPRKSNTTSNKSSPAGEKSVTSTLAPPSTVQTAADFPAPPADAHRTSSSNTSSQQTDSGTKLPASPRKRSALRSDLVAFGTAPRSSEPRRPTQAVGVAATSSPIAKAAQGEEEVEMPPSSAPEPDTLPSSFEPRAFRQEQREREGKAPSSSQSTKASRTTDENHPLGERGTTPKKRAEKSRVPLKDLSSPTNAPPAAAAEEQLASVSSELSDLPTGSPSPVKRNSLRLSSPPNKNANHALQSQAPSSSYLAREAEDHDSDEDVAPQPPSSAWQAMEATRRVLAPAPPPPTGRLTSSPERKPLISPVAASKTGKRARAEEVDEESDDEATEPLNSDQVNETEERRRTKSNRRRKRGRTTGGTDSPKKVGSSPLKKVKREVAEEEVPKGVASPPKRMRHEELQRRERELNSPVVKRSSSAATTPISPARVIKPSKYAARTLRNSPATLASASTSSASLKRRELELNPDRNQGETHAFNETVRGKKARQDMYAEACPDCVAYYARSDRQIPSGPCGHTKLPDTPDAGRGFLEQRHERMQARLNHTSRHRNVQRTEPDPPGYWQMGMPPTQAVDAINEQAKEMREEKRAYMVAEASKANGRYRYKD